MHSYLDANSSHLGAKMSCPFQRAFDWAICPQLLLVRPRLACLGRCVTKDCEIGWTWSWTRGCACSWAGEAMSRSAIRWTIKTVKHQSIIFRSIHISLFSISRGNFWKASTACTSTAWCIVTSSRTTSLSIITYTSRSLTSVWRTPPVSRALARPRWWRCGIARRRFWFAASTAPCATCGPLGWLSARWMSWGELRLRDIRKCKIYVVMVYSVRNVLFFFCIRFKFYAQKYVRKCIRIGVTFYNPSVRKDSN